MNEITGKKIFVLYPDERLRAIFYGRLRNTFEVYFIYDYEKIRSLAEYYPESIIILNLIENDLLWLPEEICAETEKIADRLKPSIIALYDEAEPSAELCVRLMKYHGKDQQLKDELMSVFTELGGRGRRNFVRYGGNEENIATIMFKTASEEASGTVHDISASGLSFSMSRGVDIRVGERLDAKLSLGKYELSLSAVKILERNFSGDAIHIIKFDNQLSEETNSKLLQFIYDSLDSEMNKFIKNLSN